MTLFSLYVTCCFAVTLLALLWVLFFHRPRFDRKYLHSLSAVSAAVEARTGRKGETAWVSQLSNSIAKEMGEGKQVRSSLRVAAALCEIGLVAVPYQQLRSRPRSQWSLLEREQYDRFPEAGAAMLTLIPSLEHAATVVRCQQAPFHSETAGYLPRMDEIPVEARILFVAKSFVRAYADQGELLARETLLQGRGTLFDPTVVDAALIVISSNGARRRTPTLTRT